MSHVQPWLKSTAALDVSSSYLRTSTLLEQLEPIVLE